MMRANLLLIVLSILSVTSASNAFNTIYVDVNSLNEPGTGSFDDPFRRIQDAIDDANEADIIEIWPGLYTGEGNYDLDPNGKSITIRSTDPNDPEVVANTIIDPNGAGRGFYFHSGEDANCMVSGLTIRNGNTLASGGGILCKEDSSPTISNCVISGNSAGLYGGGIFCDASSPEIRGCMISWNSAKDGGGMGCFLQAAPTLTNCIVSNNQASDVGGGGGGLECVDCNDIRLNSCTLVGNSAVGSGGAMRCEDSEVTINNCIFRANNAPNGAQIALESLISSPSSASINYTNLQSVETEVYVDPCSTLIWGSGNIDTDPCFASFDSNGDPNMWDFHLQSASGRWDVNSQGWVCDVNTSPCIDAGDPNSDWSGEPWPNGKRINMGAYGGTEQASMNGNPGDFNIDGEVNFEDFCELAGKWGYEGSFIENLNNNGIVNFADLRIFVENWLWRQE